MEISLSGTVFKSYEVDTKNRTREELSEESLSFDKTLTKTNESENITYQTTNENENTTNIVFTDPTNGKHVQVALDNSTIDRLKRNFSEDDFFQRENGDIRLNSKAEAFVSGWFADIAYKREFLSSDVNNDGKLTEEEYLNTKNNFGIEGIDTFSKKGISTHESVYSAYVQSKDIDSFMYRTGTEVNSLDDELNYTLNIDKDFDGKISLEESYKGEGTIEEKVKNNIKEYYSNPENMIKGELSNFFNDAINFLIDTLEKEKKYDKNGNIEIDKKQWEEIQKRHNILITESLKQDFERKREKIEDIYA
ncbi:hypothetical protein CRV03_05805 [Arcobacter sp. F155]|uniref:hypothetical protein n=1 Tax=Arcobacter sp. F155 TaxID=2044512 RepID=UPI00100B8788|nr:hypothetical protein [Arcobacter sp. F155]RXJ77198.1 hypothetical protein CRV03_05805 [Arcobacter sp. F155]